MFSHFFLFTQKIKLLKYKTYTDFLILLVVFILLLPLNNFAQQDKSKKPKLIVGVVVDQMRYDFLSRYWNRYSKKGFKKLINEGFNFKNTHYNYVPTHTGPGHASIYTGTTPSVHGIVANNWYDRDSKQMMYCTQGINPGEYHSMSPKRMLSTTITDELKAHFNFKSKTIGISLKDRGAILPAGHTADAAFWIDKKTGQFITSTYYLNSIPEWVKSFNQKKIVESYLSQNWNTLYPIETYKSSCSDSNNYERPFKTGNRSTFPYNLKEISEKEGLGIITSTPFGNDYTKDFAKETIISEELGQDEYTDFLSISFSSTDYIGHQFGPNSIEIEDTYLRLDKNIAELLEFLEKEVGKDNFLFFLTADHGVAANAEFYKEKKINGGNIEMDKEIHLIEDELKALYHLDSIILKQCNEQIYLNRKLIEEKKIDLLEVKNHIKKQLLHLDGISNVLYSEDLQKNSYHDKPHSLIQNGFYSKRSGDMAILLEPGWMVYEKLGSTHGGPYTYDTHVPLIWYGWNIHAGQSAEPVNITDIAPTISTLMEISMPNGCIGKSLEPHLKNKRTEK